MLRDLTSRLHQGHELTEADVADAVAALVIDGPPPAEKAAFLTALAVKGETGAEIAAFARELRSRSLPVPLDHHFWEDREVLDVCGTGGDRLNTFNISTTVALLCAAIGVTVAKHGNRAVTSQSGSADVLEALGIPVELEPEEAAESLQEHGFAFLFAPRFHPAFKHLAAARRLCAEQGRRTIFNFLGPLLNPARPTCQLLGVSQPHLTEPMATTLRSLGLRRAMVVCGEAPGAGMLDELSTLGRNSVSEFHHGGALVSTAWSPNDLPLQPVTLADLAGGDRVTNANIIRALLAGKDRGPRRDAVLLNTGAALFVAGRVRSITEGWELAGRVIDDGTAAAKLQQLATRAPAHPVVDLP